VRVLFYREDRPRRDSSESPAPETARAVSTRSSAGEARTVRKLRPENPIVDEDACKIMLSLTAFADEIEREKARQRTYDAMLRKAKAGHMTGGSCFG
jgi:DNA invertase Pin-like site-specific DNA recombinase